MSPVCNSRNHDQTMEQFVVDGNLHLYCRIRKLLESDHACGTAMTLAEARSRLHLAAGLRYGTAE